MARGGRVIYKKAGGRKRRARADSEAEDDDDKEYVAGESDSESPDESLVSSPAASDEEDSYELAESSDGGGDEEEEEEEETAEVARRKPSRGRPRKIRNRISDDEGEEELTSVPRRQTKARSRRRKPSASEDDEDFNPDEDDCDEEEVLVVSERKKGGARTKRAPRGRRKKGKPRIIKQKREAKVAPVKKQRRMRGPSSDDDGDDDDFVVKDRIALDKIRKNSRKTKKRSSGVRKRRSAVDSDEEDFDFVVSDEEEEEIGWEKKRKRSTKRKSNPRVSTRRKRSFVEESESEFNSFVSDEEVREVNDKRRNARMRTGTARKKRRSRDSESSDFDYEISEGELRDLRIGGVLNQPQPKKFIVERKNEGKGKEKENEDSGKQLCGICLSEEQKKTIRGVLDSCAHFFCFACIMEWSKVESRCPMCKQRFSSITKSARSDPGFGLRRAVIRVPKRDQVYQPSEEEMRNFIDPYENVVCIVCHQGGDDSLMLLCDICDSSAHTYCVGLGGEVPEGNWYCEACRSNDGSSYNQVQNTVSGPGASSSRLFSVGIETENVTINMHASTNARRSVSIAGRSSLQGIDLNVSPRDHSEEDTIAVSQASGSGASTLSGRRAIHQRIRIILSNNANRLRQRYFTPHIPRDNVESDLNLPEVDPGAERLNFASDGVNHLRNSRPLAWPNSSLSPCMFSEGSSFRQVDGAKEQVQSMVKGQLKNMSKVIPRDRDAFKDIARRSTHTILAACGIEHRRDIVVGPIQPPRSCSHSLDDGPSDLVKTCCSSCFSSFVEDVVRRVINTSF